MKKFLLTLTAITFVALPYVTTYAAEPAESQAATQNIETPIAASTIPTAPPPAEQNTPETPKQVVKIGFIDMAKIASDSDPGKAAYAEIKAKTAKYQKQIKSKERQLQKQKADIEAQMPSLTPTQRSKKAKEFQNKLESFQKYLQKADKDVRTREAELLQELYKAVVKTAGDYGTTNGYAAIVMKKELLFAGDTVAIQDLTEEMIKLLAKSPDKKP